MKHPCEECLIKIICSLACHAWFDYGRYKFGINNRVRPTEFVKSMKTLGPTKHFLKKYRIQTFHFIETDFINIYLC